MGLAVGIDPGKSGALCALDENMDPEFHECPGPHSMAGIVRGLLLRSSPPVAFYLEKVHAMPRQGVTSMFNFGMNFGQWQGVLAMTGVPVVLVTPAEWQRGLVFKSDGASPKARALAAARRLFPNCDHFNGPRGGVKDGRVDAALLAYYGLKQTIGG